jgi:hypothetical protein
MAASAIFLSESEFEVGNTAAGGTRHYMVLRADDDPDAYAAAVEQAEEDGNLTYFGIPIGTIRGRHLGGGVYEVDIVYDPNARTLAPEGSGNTPSGGSSTPPGTDPDAHMGREWTLTTGGGTRHITRSRKVTHAAKKFNIPIGEWTANNLIGESETGVAGLDIVDAAPIVRFNDKVPYVTVGYYRKMSELTGRVNRDNWDGFNAGELLNVGMDLHFKSGDGWDRSVTMNFSKNQGERAFRDYPGIGEEFNDEIVIIPGADPDVDLPILSVDPGVYRKKGWEHLDVRYVRKPNADGSGMILEPSHFYIHEVYETGEFAAMQLFNV